MGESTPGRSPSAAAPVTAPGRGSVVLAELWRQDPERLLWWVLAGTLVVKLLLAAVLPLTQDEAYFTMWGEHPSFGYSEHPPMIGWWLYPVLLLGKTRFLVRLPAVVATLAIGWGLYWLLRDRNREHAAWTAILFLLSPLNLCFVIITTDTPLLFFSFWSVAFFLRAWRSGSRRAWIAAGLLLGCAFLSKYFAVLLGLAYLVVLVAMARSRERVLGGMLLYAAVLPAGALDIWWNVQHSWLHVNSNLFYRNNDAAPNLETPAMFALTALWLLLPAGLLEWWRVRRQLRARLAAEGRAMALLYLVPMGVFAALSVAKRVGLHWFLSFAPLAYLITWAVTRTDDLRRAVRFTAVYSAAHVVVILAVVAVPPRLFEGSSSYQTIVMAVHHEELAAALAPHLPGRMLGAEGYGVACLLSFYNPGYFSNFEKGSWHGRQDDLITDWREWAGRDAVIVCREPPDLEWYTAMFATARVETIVVAGATFHLVLGEGFDFDAFRQRVLVPIVVRYYDVPSWLPMRQCWYRARYFPQR